MPTVGTVHFVASVAAIETAIAPLRSVNATYSICAPPVVEEVTCFTIKGLECERETKLKSKAYWRNSLIRQFYQDSRDSRRNGALRRCKFRHCTSIRTDRTTVLYDSATTKTV